MMCSDSRSACSASGRSRPCVSEMTPIRMGAHGSTLRRGLRAGWGVLAWVENKSSCARQDGRWPALSLPKGRPSPHGYRCPLRISELCSLRHCATRVDSIQGLPQHARRALGGVQSRLRRLRVGGDAIFELVAPNPRVVDIGGGMEREVSTGFVVRGVHISQAVFFFLGDARHLRFVRIESGQRLFGRAFAGYPMKMPEELA